MEEKQQLEEQHRAVMDKFNPCPPGGTAFCMEGVNSLDLLVLR